ncbi:MAG: glycerophosphodiester phosphodiesterase family protein [Planctomycetota bacterium]
MDLEPDPARLAERNAGVQGPPWILGHRGAPRLAPENTLSSLRTALALGLDGVEFDVQPSREGEPVVLHDETLDRTTNGRGPVVEHPLVELLGLDAGGWFGKRFANEPLPHLSDALEVGETARPPIFMIELKTVGLVDAVVEQLARRDLARSVYLASFHRSVVEAARDAGLRTMLLAVHADEDDRAYVRRERIDAHGVAADGWRTAAGELDWSCERWAWSVDLPEDLLEACRRPLAGFNTNEALRAASVRALVALAPDDRGPYPLEVPELEVRPDAHDGTWSGDWQVVAFVRNPFAWRVAVEVGFAVRQGAFDVSGSPTSFELDPGERRRVDLAVKGGTHSPGEDPLLVARYAFTGPLPEHVEARALVLDAPLVRRRTAVAMPARMRQVCLTERPGAPRASVLVQRRGRALLVSLENAAGLLHPRVVVRVGDRVVSGANGVRVALPEGFDSLAAGIPFSLAVCGVDPARPHAGLAWRRWAGGLPTDLLSGEPGRLVADR